MTRRNTIITIVIVIILFTAGMFALKRGEQVANQPATGGNTSGKKMAFVDLFHQGGTYKCSVTQIVNNATATGTTYMNSGKLRGDFVSDYQGQKVNVSFIIDEAYTYLWNSVMTNGFKLRNDTTTQGSSTQVTASPNTYLESIGDYDCQPWNYDASVFTLPKGVTFQEVTQ